MDDLLHVAELCGPDATDCQSVPELLMPATILGPNEARCKAPEVDIWTPWERRQHLELTINGDAAAKTANNHTFAIFGQPGFEVAISSVRPQGAPTAGGTLVEVRVWHPWATSAEVCWGGFSRDIRGPPRQRCVAGDSRVTSPARLGKSMLGEVFV